MNKFLATVFGMSIVITGNCNAEKISPAKDELSRAKPAASAEVANNVEEVSTLYKVTGQFDRSKSGTVSIYADGDFSMGGRGRTPIATGEIKNGRIVLEAEVSRPQIGLLVIRAGGLSSRPIIVEPGEFTLSDSGGFSLSGGKYNNVINHSWATDEYKSLQKRISTINTANRKAFSAEYKKNGLEAAKKLSLPSTKSDQMELSKLRLAAIQALLKHNDPLVRLFAAQSMGFAIVNDEWQGDLFVEAIKELVVEPEDQALRDHVFKRLTDSKYAHFQKKSKKFHDATAQTVDGKDVVLSDVLSENRYVYLDFWASWCHPCRASFPHLKELYTKYKKDGFEVVGFSADNSHEDWVEALKEDELPWINLRDDSNPKGGAVKEYGVTFYPTTILLDAKTRKVIAKNLHGEKLDNKLKELMGH